ncbi:hypothetical protein NTD86_07580 [Pseudomonas sp. 7P_10.2_Bac1]|uniref:COG3650 family protein n=1 Tax=Pseudomonas sp. 7P_10.2_Bac1 TaxID=2971614 RepID=UPI0021CA2E42|nr:hypothetical protein [Pseudomonas sp. 7P_10.2_Bac1]MCU1726846.1 hypothetical protein [Pseudomonas sp. 7P_10.2_Bac1]
MKKEVFAPLAVLLLPMILSACSQHAPSLSSSAPEAQGVGQQFVARGNEPFWTIKVNGKTLAWITPDHLQGKQLHVDQVVSGNNTKYTGTDQGKVFTLVIEPKPCTDSMSGETFSHTSTWTYDGESNMGCAATGN